MSYARAARPARAPSGLLSGALTGVGVAAFLDETVFHQLLRWHHFYDRGTTAAGIVSDGVFHAVGTAALVAGLFLYADLQRRGTFQGRRWAAAVLLGWGGFQLYDGLVQHKVLRLHQVRYGVELLPYDLAWNGAAVLGIAVGGLLLARARRRGPAGPAA